MVTFPKQIHYAVIAVVSGLSVGAMDPLPVSAAVAIRREPPEGFMRLGQRILVDDGTCPTGQVKQVTAAQLGPQGIVRSRTCVKR